MSTALHPSPNVDRVWRLGLEAESPLICTAGRTGFYIDAVGNYWKCGALASSFAPIGNILRDGELKFAASPVCERFPTQTPNPGSEIQCWCVENKVLDVTKAAPKALETFYDEAFFHIDVSRLCNYSCHYCTVSKPIFDARNLAKKREHLTEWERKPYMDEADLALIAREIFAKCDNVVLRIAGMMEPLMNPDILAFFEACKANLHKVKQIRLMSNLGIEKTFETILDMGFGKKLNTVVSMHVVDDNFDPFRVVRQIKRAQAAGTIISSHIVPSPIVRETMIDYLDFFSIHGVRVRPVPYIVDDPAGRPLEKGTQQPGHVPRHYRAMKDFLGDSFATRVAGKGYAAYVEQIRSLNADTYEVLAAFNAEGGAEADAQGDAKRKIFMLQAERSAPATVATPLPRPAAPVARVLPVPPVAAPVVASAVAPAAAAVPAARPADSGRPGTTGGVSALRQAALQAHASGALDRAVALLQQALQLSPLDPEVLCDLATMALTSGEPVPAVTLAKRALEQAPDHPIGLYTLGMALAQGGALAPAIRALQRVADGDGAAALRAQGGGLADNVVPMLERLRQLEAA